MCLIFLKEKFDKVMKFSLEIYLYPLHPSALVRYVLNVLKKSLIDFMKFPFLFYSFSLLEFPPTPYVSNDCRFLIAL